MTDQLDRSLEDFTQRVQVLQSPTDFVGADAAIYEPFLEDLESAVRTLRNDTVNEEFIVLHHLSIEPLQSSR